MMGLKGVGYKFKSCQNLFFQIVTRQQSECIKSDHCDKNNIYNVEKNY